MKSKMRKTLNVLYPDDFGKSRKKTARPGFFSRKITHIKSYLRNIEKPTLFIAITLLITLLTGIYSVHIYNHFTSHLNDIHTAYSNVEKEMQRRNDLINNLIPPTLSYLTYEKDLFSHVVKIRKDSLTQDPSKKITAASPQDSSSGMAAAGLPSLFGIFENYPDLKASKPFQDIMQELIETENRVAEARKSYNSKVNTYNTIISKIPANIFAKALGYKTEKWFTADNSAFPVPDMSQLQPDKSD